MADLLSSPYIVAILAGWCVAQGTKNLIIAIRDKDISKLRQVYLSGNMPSAHSASTVALLTVIGLRDGVDSAVFGVSALFASIVMYDAIMVRRTVGEHGIALETLIKNTRGRQLIVPRIAKGHTPLEVLVGAVIGLLIGLVVFFATK